jgi:3-hydroxyacyl-[acyl-carrier-protein] dehydratase
MGPGGTRAVSSAVRFELVDRVVERSAERIVTLKTVPASEEYLRDHFESFPVMPGVLMLEAMVQAARLLAGGDGRENPRLVLGAVRGVRFGRLVLPGSILKFRVERVGGGLRFRGEGWLVEGGGSAEARVVSGEFEMRPVRPGRSPGATIDPAMGNPGCEA